MEGLIKTMSWSQLVSWFEYSQIEPFGETRADLRAGIVASVIANVNRPKNKKPFTAADFMPDFAGDRKVKPLTSKESWDSFKSSFKVAVAEG